MAFVEKNQYKSVATEYQSIDEIPHAQLENELVKTGLADCTGLRVLDLGGGEGQHARRAIEAGASWVDIVDVSQSMLDVGKATETKAGRNVTGWHLADISKPMSEQCPALSKESYDVVMAIWPFDHARTVQELEGMWQNVTLYMKPGGRFVGIRVANTYSESVTSGKYGTQYSHIEEIPDGVRYECAILTTPRFAFEGTSMKASYSGSTEIPEKCGLTEIKVLPLQGTETVKKNPEYWALLVNDPYFAAFTARKK